MSYIQCIAIGAINNDITPQVIITSDGRVTDQCGTILQEDYKKIDRINSKVAVAYSGTKEFCEQIIHFTKDKFSDIEIIDINDFHNHLIDVSKDILSDKDSTIYKCQFLIGGLTNTNNLGVLTLSTNHHYSVTKSYVDSTNLICYSSACSDSMDNNLLGINLNNLVTKNKILSISDFYKTINDTSRNMALTDLSVNSTIFREIIKK